MAKALLLFRSAPRCNTEGTSTSQIIFNRPNRDCIPAHRRSFAPEWQKSADTLEKRGRRSKQLQIEHFNKKTCALEPLNVGQHVLVQHPITKLWATPGVIVETGPNRHYLIKTPVGRIFRRYRRFLRRRIPVMPNQPGSPKQETPAPPPAVEQQQHTGQGQQPAQEPGQP